MAGSAPAATTTTLRDERSANGARSQGRSWTRLAYLSTWPSSLKTKLPWRNRKQNKRDSRRYRILERRRRCWPSRSNSPMSTLSWSNCLSRSSLNKSKPKRRTRRTFGTANGASIATSPSEMNAIDASFQSRRMTPFWWRKIVKICPCPSTPRRTSKQPSEHKPAWLNFMLSLKQTIGRQVVI